MYLSNLKLWNFRKFGKDNNFDLNIPHLIVNFNKGLNVLIGENDSGKSAIIDAIKLVLKTHSYEWLKVDNSDFFTNTNRLRIEIEFNDFTDAEAKNFTEWLGWIGEGELAVPYLRLIYDIKRNPISNLIFPTDVKAGVDSEGYQLNAEAKEYLKVTYLKPLRDAENELIPKKNSRLSQILQAHEAFKGRGNTHDLVTLFESFNTSIEKYFEGQNNTGGQLTDQKGRELKEEVDKFIKAFYDKSKESKFEVVDASLKNILEKLELTIKDEVNPGLGTLNRLFMSSELLHLNKRNWTGVRIGLIEELEAHLHAQAQMQIIESLQAQENIQLILTTHSPNIGSKVKLENLIICSETNTYPMGMGYSKLKNADYSFLERFLDATKANLFFAKGVIIVEGWAEELLLPTLAKKLGISLTEKGVSIVNVGSTAFLRYSRIFQRMQLPHLNIPVALITDLDVKPENENTLVGTITTITHKTNVKKRAYDGQLVKTFVSPHWTLEYCLALCTDPFFETYYQALQKCRPRALRESFVQYTTRKTREVMALDLYQNHIKEKKLKTIFAQVLAEMIDQNTLITKASLEADANISYLLDAIKYASRV